MAATALLWIAVIAPLAGAGASFLVELPRRAAQVCLAFSLVALAAAVATPFLYLHAGGRPTESAITFWTFVPSYAGSPGNPADRSLVGAVTDFHPQVGVVVDAVSCALAVCVSAIAAAAHLHAGASLRGIAEGRRQLWLISVLTASGIMVAAAANLFTLLLAWGVGAVATYLVVHPESPELRRARTARRAFLLLRVGDLALLLAAAVLWARFAPDLAALPPAAGREISDPYNFANLLTEWHRAAAGGVPGVGPRTLDLLSALVLLAGVVRLGLVPLGGWLVDSVESSPPALAVLAPVATTAAGGVLLLRFMPLLAETPHALTVLAALGALTVLVAGMWAVSESDVFRSLAWMTAAGSGMVAIALGSGGYGAALFQLITRSLAVAAMVLAVANLAGAYRSRTVGDFGGAWSRLRRSSLALVVGALSAGGLVLLGGFWSLRSVVAAVLHNRAFNGARHPVWLEGLFLGITVLGLVLISVAPLRLALLLCAGEPARRRGFPVQRLRDAERRCRIAALSLAAAAALVGLVGLPGVRRSLFRYAVLPGPGSAQPLSLTAYAIAGLACTAGLLLAVLAYRPRAPLAAAGARTTMRLTDWRGRLARWPLPRRAVPALVLGPAGLLARFDERVLARAADEAETSLGTLAAGAGRLRLRSGQVTVAGGLGALVVLLVAVALGASGHGFGSGR
ncbi:MAG: proton-conducting transporter membrane subunit [Candidatus Dormibacteria bacterium]